MAVKKPNTAGWPEVYVAYCDSSTGEIPVRKESEPPPNPLFPIVGYGPTIQAARQAGGQFCKIPDKPQDSGNKGPGGTDVGGAPCPPGYKSCPPSGGSAGGDSTASTLDCIKVDAPCPGEPTKQSPDKENCCAQIANGFSAVTNALKEINSTLDKKLGTGKKSIDDSFDEILEKLREKFEKGQKTCKECTQMLKQGLGGTIEYAVACAGACLKKGAAECSLGDESTWGEPCKGCGEPCCKCDKGVCEPTPCEEEEKPKSFIGWCNPVTGSIAVTEADKGPPGAGFYQVALGSDEQAVATQAAANCHKQEETGTPPTTPPDRQPINVPNALCDFDQFISGAGASRITSTSAAANAAAGIAQASKAILGFGFEGVNVGILGEVLQGVVRSVTGQTGYYAEHLLPTAIAALGCSDNVFTQGVTLLAAIDTISKQSGSDLSQWTDQIRYVVNARCRQQFMTPDQAMAAYLANAIDYRKLDGHWAIANICNESLNSTLEAAKAKPIPLQLAVMRRRKMIDSGGYHAGMRRLGYLETGTAEQLFQLTEQVPPMSDIIRFMVRDTDDAALVAKFGLDAKFDEKYQSGLREWAEFQGIPEKVARYNWRAHWGIPAPGQLFTFYQRLRDNPKFGGRDKLLTDVKDALIQQDILPFWHDHFLAVSFHPLGRVDIRRAFNNGTLKDDELVPAYRQLGYSDADADKLALFSRRLRRDSAVSHRAIKLWLKFAIDRTQAKSRMVADGLPDDIVDLALSDASVSFAASPAAAAFVRGDLTRQQFVDRLQTAGVEQVVADKIADQLSLKITDHPALKGVVLGVIESDDARQQMLDSGMSNQVVDNLLLEANKAVDYAFAAACQKGIKRRYLMGEFDQQEAINKLLGTGVTNARATRLAESWNCEKSSVGKAVPTNRLCDWLSRGVISSLDFASRLIRLGHTEIDAARIRDDCLASISVKRQKQADKEARDQVALERREQAALRRQAATVQRIESQQIRAAQSTADKRRNREMQLMSAASKASKKCDCELGVVVSAVRDGHSMLQREYGMTVDESLATLIKAAEAWEGGDIETYGDTVTTLALGLIEPADAE